MSETTNWTGSASGARTGTMTVEITRDGTQMTGTLRLREPGAGELHSRFVGHWTTDNKLSADTLEHFVSNPGGPVTLPQTGKMEGTFNVRENVIRGHWRTEVDALSEFRWTHAVGPPSKPTGVLVAVPTHVARYWERCATSTKMLFGESRLAWDKRFTKWLILGLQLVLAGLVGYLVIAFVVDSLTSN
jgi:hypothetical protein